MQIYTMFIEEVLTWGGHQIYGGMILAQPPRPYIHIKFMQLKQRRVQVILLIMVVILGIETMYLISPDLFLDPQTHVLAHLQLIQYRLFRVQPRTHGHARQVGLAVAQVQLVL